MVSNSKISRSIISFSFLKRNIENDFKKTDISFSQELFNHIDAKGMNDVEVYKRARIDRRLFSKIRKKGYVPNKRTIIALALALELEYAEAVFLLNLAGFSLSISPSMPFDIIISSVIRNKIYDIDKVNGILYQYDLPLFGE